MVCPASLMGNWESEIRRFAPGVAVRRFHGTARDLDRPRRRVRAHHLRHHARRPSGWRTLATVPWDLVVADEAQHIKNATSSTARNLRTITSRCRVALTGTPVENNLTELWAILDWATPGLLGSRAAFRKVWAAPIESGVDPAVARRFAQLVEPFLLRRRKSDPGIAPELPAKTETDQVIGLTREQVVLYESLVRESMERIERADEDTRRGLVLALLTGLKQICNHPAHYLRQPSGRLKGRSEKLDVCDELLGTILAENGSVLVFTQYVEMARLLERHLAAASIPTLFLHGGTPVRAREQMVPGLPGRRRPGLPALAQGRWHRPQPDPGRPRDPLRPLVEPRRRGPGDRPRPPDRPDPGRCRSTASSPRAPSSRRSGQLLQRKRALADSVLGSGEVALTELTDDELRDLVRLRVSTGSTDDAGSTDDVTALDRRHRLCRQHRLGRRSCLTRSCSPGCARVRGSDRPQHDVVGPGVRPVLRGAHPRRRRPRCRPRRWPDRAGSARSSCSRRWPRPSSTPAPRIR